jgi:hypothetical protein
MGIGTSEVIRELLWKNEVKRMGIQWNTTEWELSQFSVEDNHGKLVVEGELEVSLWRLCVWLEDLVKVRLF